MSADVAAGETAKRPWLSPLNQRRWQNFKANRRGYWSLWIFLVLFVLSLFSEFIASDRPVLASYKGEILFPTLVDYPEEKFGGFYAVTDYRDPVIQDEIKANGWLIWPPIRYSYRTVNNDIPEAAPAKPSWLYPVEKRCERYLAGVDDPNCTIGNWNWLGTDDQGRDVVARLVYGFRISVLFGLTPLVTSVFAAFWLGERALTPSRLAGMALGLAGLATIFAEGEGAGGAQAALGLAALVLAVLIYSASMVWIKRIGDDSPPLATTAGTLAVSLPLFGLVWWIVEGRLPADLPPRTAAAIVYLGAFGSVLGFALYFYVIRHMEAGRVALITLITPVLALLLGQTLNAEEIGTRVWLGAALIAAGLLLHQWTGLVGALRRAEQSG